MTVSRMSLEQLLAMNDVHIITQLFVNVGTKLRLYGHVQLYKYLCTMH